MRSQLSKTLPFRAVLPSCAMWTRTHALPQASSERDRSRVQSSRSRFLSTLPAGANRSQGSFLHIHEAPVTSRALAQARWRSSPTRMRHVDPLPTETVYREPVPLDIKRALVVTKTTRYEDEARAHKEKSVAELSAQDLNEVDKVLDLQGFSVDALKHSHESQTNSLDLIIQSLNEKGIDFDITTSGESFSGVHDSGGASQHGKYDIVISAGGDGTFLRAALDNDGSTPQVGINTDPSRSRGQLCADFAHNLSRHLDRLRTGHYTWVRRSRIKTTMVHLDGSYSGALEQYALNEVCSDEEEWEKHKCSGLLISTGTGTSAWSAEASKVNPQDVMAVLRGIESVYKGIRLEDVLSDGFDAGAVASAANHATASERLAADGEELQLLVREPILTAGSIDRGICIWQGAKPSKARLLGDGAFGEYHPMRSIARQIRVSSVGCDVNLVLDGRTWVELPRGVEARFETAHQNPLWTFSFD